MKIYKCREIIYVNDVLLYDRPIELMESHVNYLLHNGFKYENCKTLICEDTSIIIQYYIFKVEDID